MKYVERDPLKCFGMPSLLNRRITVFDLVIMVFLEPDTEAYLSELEVSKDQAKEVLDYCANQLCKFDNYENKYPFCDGCKLRDVAENYIVDESMFYEVKNDDGDVITFSKDDNTEVFQGSILEYKNEEEGKEVWLIAKKLLEGSFWS